MQLTPGCIPDPHMRRQKCLCLMNERKSDTRANSGSIYVDNRAGQFFIQIHRIMNIKEKYIIQFYKSSYLKNRKMLLVFPVNKKYLTNRNYTVHTI
jgi:hypothetical protein